MCDNCSSHSSSIIDRIFKNNKRWVNDNLVINSGYFEELAQGQNPEILYFGCSDSRVTVEQIMGLQPGEVFVHRNIANMVHSHDLSALSSLHFAITHLKIKKIVVCGHYGCGGVFAALNQENLGGSLNPYVRDIKDVYRIHKDELNAILDADLRYDRLVELNVKEQVFNILKTSVVQVAFQAGEVQVYGWVFDIKTGKLIDLEIDIGSLLEDIREIYKIAP